MLALYDISFIKHDGSLDLTTNVQRMGVVMMKELMNEGVNVDKYWKQNQYIDKLELRIYTHDYFSPITSTRVMRQTKNTYFIHYLASSWRDGKRATGWKNWTITREIVYVMVQVKRFIKTRCIV